MSNSHTQKFISKLEQNVLRAYNKLQSSVLSIFSHKKKLWNYFTSVTLETSNMVQKKKNYIDLIECCYSMTVKIQKNT